LRWYIQSIRFDMVNPSWGERETASEWRSVTEGG
jgi:hypothetical protein